MQTKNNNDTPHFNIADVIIIIAIIAVIAAFALRIYNILGVSDDVTEVRVEFEVTGVSTDTLSLKENSKLYSAEDDSLVGYLEAFTVKDMTTMAYNDAGELVRTLVPGKSTVTGTIVINCTKTANGFYLGGTKLLSNGDVLTLYTTSREMEFRIKNISEVKDEENEEGTSSSAANTTSATVTAAPTQK